MSLSRGVGLGSLGLSNSLPNLGGSGTEDGSDPTTRFAPGANSAWDFINNYARFKDVYYGPLANTPGWSFTRASTGYAQTAAGVLVPFASGELRRTDKGVLIEGAGTNLCLQSQTFGTTWTVSRCLAFGSGSVADAIAAPDGTTTADKVVEDATAANTHSILQSFTKAASAITYTASVYAKAAERSALQILVYGTTTADRGDAFFDLSGGVISVAASASGTFTSASATISALANGWYRCTVTVTSDTATTLSVRAFLGSTTTVTSYNGDGTSGLYLWGAQLEATAYASSYVPTTTGSATRAADSLTVTGVTGLDYPLSLYAETDLVTLGGGSVSQSYVEIDDSSNSNRALLYGSNGSQGSRMYVATAGVQQALPSVGALATGVRKTAGRCSLNSFQVAGNGTLATEDTSGTVPATPNRILFGKENDTGTELFGYLRRLALFSRALSDGELQALTP